ncbi:MAG: M42 family metallopeptidase [Candidatus Omnitrophica bacterium]|nr:M42 family metallopeptidase [Candidatus Omnitrophota bacterium]
MDDLLKKLLDSAGVSGYEKEVSEIMRNELKKSTDQVFVDSLGNVIAKKGNGKKKIMLCAHMDEVGLVVKHITKEGYINFIKIGGIDDRILIGKEVIIKTKNADVLGIIGAKAPHLQKEEEAKKLPKYEDMFIDIGVKTKEDALKKVEIGDPIVFRAKAGVLNGDLYFGKAVDDRVGCYVLLKVMERLKVDAQIFAVSTVQEEVGLKGARTAAFKIAPDFSIILDTTTAGDTPQVKEADSCWKLGEGVAITLIEAAGRGIIVNENIKDIFISVARKNKIKFQVGILEGGMTDAAIIYMTREGIPSGVLSVPARYIHSPYGVFNIKDVEATISLTIKTIEHIVKENLF